MNLISSKEFGRLNQDTKSVNNSRWGGEEDSPIMPIVEKSRILLKLNYSDLNK